MSIDAQIESVRKALLGQMEESKNIVFSGLLDNQLFNRIPESIFVNYFLPCFMGNAQNNNWVMEWVSVAGTPMAKVGVVKDGTDQVLFMVPALLHTNNLLMERGGGDMQNIFSRYEQLNSNLPVNGLRFLSEALNSKNQELISKLSMDEVKTDWMNILIRYNLAAPITEQNQIQTPSEDYFDF